jgi:hypothetical protein
MVPLTQVGVAVVVETAMVVSSDYPELAVPV